MKLLLFIFLLLLPIVVLGQARTSERIVSVPFSQLDPTGNLPNGSERYIINGLPGSTPCAIGGSGTTAYKVAGVWQCPNLTPGVGTGDMLGPAASAVGEMVLFGTTTGKNAGRSNTLNGIPFLTNGVVSVLSSTGSGNVVRASSPVLTTPTFTSPTIDVFTNATHTHETTVEGGQLNASNVFSAGIVPTNRILATVVNSKCLRVSNVGQIEVAADDCGTGSGGTPGGVSGNLAFNEAGSFGGLANSTYVSASGVLSLTQKANGNDLLTLLRFTDSAPTGNLLRLRNAANTADLFSLAATGVVNVSNTVTITNIAAPSTPAAGFTSIWTDATDKNLKAKDDAGNVSATVRAITCGSTDKISAISSAGVPTCSADQITGGGSGITDLNALTATSQTFADVDDTNVTLAIGSVSSIHTFTIAWAGTLAKARQHAATAYIDAGNVWSTGAQDMGAATSFKVPTSAGAGPTANGLIAFDTTSNTWEGGVNGTNRIFTFTAGAQTLSDKTLDNSTVYAARDTLFTLQDNADATKTVNFELGGLTTSTNRVVTIANAASNTVIPTTATTNQWITHIDSTGTQVKAQPAFSNLSGTLVETQGGTGQTSWTQGDIPYASAANTLSKLAKNTSATRYLSNTGSSNSPAWAQVDVSNGITGSFTDGTLILNGGDYGAADASLPGSPVEKGLYLNTNAGSRRLFLYNNAAYREIHQAGISGPISLANGGTAQASWTASRCVQVNSAGTALESAAAACGSGGSGTPGGADTNVQVNDAGAFFGEAAFTYNKTTNTLTADIIATGGSGAGYIELFEGTAPTVVANRLTFAAPVDVPAAGLLYILPSDTPSNGEQLTANISGTTVTLSWDTAGSGGSGDAVSVNGSGATDANFINTTASGTVPSVTWSLNTGASPDEITISAIGPASTTEAGVITTGTQGLAGIKILGHTAALGRLSQSLEITTSADFGGMAVNTFSTTAGEAGLVEFNRSKSATKGTQTVVASGDLLGGIMFRGSDGTAFINSASVRGEVDGTPGTNDMPGRLVFYTTPDGSATMVERWRITHTGHFLATTDNSIDIGASGATRPRTIYAGTSVVTPLLTLGAVAVTPTGTELNFVDGVTSSIQTQLDNKQPLDSDLTTIAGLTATTDNFIVSVSSAWASRTVAQVKTTLALNNVDNTSDASKPVSTAQQTALDLKANLASPTFTGTVTIPTPFTLGAVSVLPTGTELNFVDGVTSGIQGQLDAKQPLDSDLTTWAGVTPSANGQSLVAAANYAAMRALLDLEAGTDFLGFPTGTPTGSKFLRDDNSWQTIAGGGDALVANPLSQFAATTSAQLAGVLSNETGSSLAVFNTSPVLVTPRITTALHDTNGNEVIITPATTSAVNEITVTNSATGTAVSIAATGGDTNIDLRLSAKGTGKLVLGDAGATTSYLDLLNSAAPSTPASGTSTVYVKTTDLVLNVLDSAGNASVTVRPDAGASNNFLTGITTAGVITKAQPSVANLSSSTSASLRTVLSDENGTGAALFSGATSPDFTTSITTGSTTFALLNTTATTVNAYGATTTLNMGASAALVLNFGGSTTAAEFRYLEPSASGTNYTAFKAKAQTANITYTLPDTVGGTGTVLTDAAGDGVLSWTTPGGSGTVTATGGNLTANAVVLGAGSTDTKVVAGIITDGTSKLTLGVAGTSVGSVDLKNATSGTITLAPVTGALGTVTLSLPATTGTLALNTASSETVSGLIEIATTAEINTGTDASRAMAPDQFAASNFGTRVVQMVAFDFTVDTAVGDGKFYFVVPEELNGMVLVGVRSQVVTAGTTNATNVDLARCATAATGNACSGTVVDMLSTNITIDTGENSTDTAAAAAVIDTANDDVTTGQVIRVDVDAVSTTAAKGLIVTLKFRLP